MSKNQHSVASHPAIVNDEPQAVSAPSSLLLEDDLHLHFVSVEKVRIVGSLRFPVGNSFDVGYL